MAKTWRIAFLVLLLSLLSSSIAGIAGVLKTLFAMSSPSLLLEHGRGMSKQVALSGCHVTRL